MFFNCSSRLPRSFRPRVETRRTPVVSARAAGRRQLRPQLRGAPAPGLDGHDVQGCTLLRQAPDLGPRLLLLKRRPQQRDIVGHTVVSPAPAAGVGTVNSPAAVACAELRRGAERAWSLRAYTSPRAC